MKYIPTKSSLQYTDWLLPTGLALCLHSFIFFPYDFVQSNQEIDNGAKNIGAGGIEISLRKIAKPVQTVTAEIPSKTLVTPPKPKTKPKTAQKPKPVQSKAIVPVTTPVTTTTPPSEPVSDQSATNSFNSVANPDTFEEDSTDQVNSAGGGNPEVKISYQRRLITWLNRYKRYPKMAKRREQEGQVKVEFTIDKDGNILSHDFILKSEYNSLNKAVARMLKKASPVPAVPIEMQANQSNFTFTVPIEFSLQRL